MMGKGETTGGTSSQGSTTIAFFKNSYSTTLLRIPNLGKGFSSSSSSDGRGGRVIEKIDD
jgi:hypothetical protein